MEQAPPLSGVDFLNSWAGQTTDELFAYLRDEMPPGQAGSLSDSSYVDLVAYLLESNGAVPSERTLTADAGVTIGDAADISEARRAAQVGERLRRRSSRFVNQEVPHALTPVTDALLADPPPGDWLSWRRTRDSHGYSPLDQVTRDNVAELKLAWSISIRPGNPLRSHKCGGDRHIPSPGGSRTVVRTPPQKVPLALSPREPCFQAMEKGSRAEGDGSTST